MRPLSDGLLTGELDTTIARYEKGMNGQSVQLTIQEKREQVNRVYD